MQVTGYRYEHWNSWNSYDFVAITTTKYWGLGFVPKIIVMEKNELVRLNKFDKKIL
jgi:hypothetical protein